MGHLLKILLLTPLEKYDSNINENVSVSPVTMCKYKLFDFFFFDRLISCKEPAGSIVNMAYA